MFEYQLNNELTDGICLKLENFEQVKDIIDEIPHKEYLDLLVTYFYFLHDKKSFDIRTLTKNDVEVLGLDEEDLYELALRNTMRILPPKFIRLDEIIGELINRYYSCDIDDDDIMSSPLFYLGNKTGAYGSSVILYDNILERLSESFEEDYYLIPSSIHEYLIVTDSEANNNPDYLIDMVRSVNSECLSKDLILSNNVYHFCCESKKLSVLTK